MRTYGTVTYEPAKKAWQIKCEPHVAIRLKRVFSRIDQNSHGMHSLSDTVDNARDLAWFIERYPMTVQPLEYLEMRATEHRDAQSLVDALRDSRVAPPAFDLAVPARDYQRVAAAMVLANGGLLLADEVGLGKTISAICTLADPRTLPALVVTMTHLPTQWQREITRFAPKLRTHILKKGSPYNLSLGSSGKRCEGRHRWKIDTHAAGGARCARCDVTREDAYHGKAPSDFPDVIITNYHKLNGWADTLGPLVKSVIFDEVQELRHSDSAKYKAASFIRSYASFATGASATPIFNYGGEIFQVLNILRPGALGDEEEFVREWCTHSYGDKPRIADPAAFGIYARDAGLMLRRTRVDVGRELPALSKVEQYIEIDEKALDDVSRSCSELARTLLREGEAFKGEKMQASEELSNKLRQATGIGKAPFVADFVRMLVESGEKVVLFGWHRAVYEIWNERLKDLNPAMYTGTESPHAKEMAKQAFVDGRTQVLIMSLRSGAGLDGIQGSCRTVVFGELDWSPAVHHQAIGRVHRDGQKEPVVAYFLVADSGADPIISDVLGVKSEQQRGVVDPKADIIERLDTGGGHMKRLAAGYLSQRGEESVKETGT